MDENLAEARLLGKNIQHPKNYDPEILVAVPRKINREIYQIKEDQLPFVGVDSWHAYELSFLTRKGLPVTGVLKLVYPCDSPYLVESKSLKLYLNAFNMERYGNNSKEGVEILLKIIQKDLELLLKSKIQLSFFNHVTQIEPFDFQYYRIIEENKEVEEISFEAFTEMPDLIQSTNQAGVVKIGTHLLRSNCKITHQPDWGSAYIYIKGENLPEEFSLLQYLVSIRNENHFHEEICEMIYERLWKRFTPEELMVSCIYTRRGGIDICPSRASHAELLPKKLINPIVLTQKLLRQ